MANIVFIQSEKEKINNNSIECLVAIQNFSRQTNNEIYAVTFNENVANKLKNYNLDKIIYVDNSELKEYNALYYTSAFKQLNDKYSPKFICFGHTYQTRDWVPRLSARLNVPFVADCVNYIIDGNISFFRPIYQAKLNEKVNLNDSGIISFQAGSYSKDDIQSGNTDIEQLSLDLTDTPHTIRPGEKFKETAGGVDLTSADVIVSIGRGISKEENIPVAESLANKLNAQIGASRPVVDAGWLDHSRQVGSSGQTVSPKLYFSIGISGAIQHLVGMKGSKNIIAINKDPNAPIFEIADYAVVGDIFEILPKLTEQL